MSRIIPSRPIFQKGAQPVNIRKPMRKISAKRKQHWQSPEGRADFAHMGKVKTLPCCACGSPAPSEAHHCKDIPPFGEQGLYKVLPAGIRSHARDTIPLCEKCHRTGPNAYHRSRYNFAAIYGPDYSYIGPTRAAVAAMTGEVDF